MYRNAIFSGLTPLEMEKKFPQYWKNDPDEGGKNLYEAEFLTEQLKRLGLDIKQEYYKITNFRDGKKLADNFKGLKDNDLTTIVYNFVDMLSHAKTEMEVVKELASDDKAYRSLTVSWFRNSPLLDMIQQAQKMGFKLILTTDHGTRRYLSERAKIEPRRKTGTCAEHQRQLSVALKRARHVALLPYAPEHLRA